VFEIFRKQIPSENGRIPNDEGSSSIVPWNDIVDGAVINEMICLCEKRRWSGSLRLASGGIGVVFRGRSHGEESTNRMRVLEDSRE
jgi:hypothetical protein